MSTFERRSLFFEKDMEAHKQGLGARLSRQEIIINPKQRELTMVDSYGVHRSAVAVMTTKKTRIRVSSVT
jgi:hypothetical protein